MNKAYRLARVIFSEKIEAMRKDVDDGLIEVSEAIEELAIVIYYCDAFTDLDIDQAAELAEILITK